LDFLPLISPGVFDAVLIAVPGCGVGSELEKKSMIHDGYDASHGAKVSWGILGIPPSKLCSVSSLDSWNPRILWVSFLRNLSGGDNLLKIHGNWENMLTPAQNKNLWATGCKGPPRCVVRFCVANHLRVSTIKMPWK